jgi:YD repeat-containing protein
MSERTSYEPGTPSWVELSGTPDVDAAEAFYRDLLGWEIPEQPNSAELGGYRRAQLNGRDVAGVSPKMQDDQPIAWATYVSVEDADATLAKVRDAGGTVAPIVNEDGAFSWNELGTRDVAGSTTSTARSSAGRSRSRTWRRRRRPAAP